MKGRNKIYLMYADESGSTGTDYDNNQQTIFVLGIAIINDKNWHKINYLFSEEKKEICPFFEENELHANEIFNSKKDSYFGKNDWHDNLEILDKLVDLILTFDIQFEYVLIDKKDFKKKMQEKYNNKIKIDPYLYAFSHFYNEMCQHLQEIEENGFIFLDQILKIDKELYKIYPIIHTEDHRIIEHPFSLSSDNSNFIQIADIFAFYVNKYYCIKNGYKDYSDEKKQHCLNIYQKFSKKIRLHII